MFIPRSLVKGSAFQALLGAKAEPDPLLTASEAWS